MIYGSPEKPSAGWVMEASKETGLLDNGGSGAVRITEGEDRHREGIGGGGNRHSGADGEYCCPNMYQRTVSTLDLLNLKYHFCASGQRY